MARDDRLIWIDLEMTGLEPAKERIIEMAIIITDAQLNTLAESPVLVVNQPNSIIDAMDEWNTRQHGGSGLIDRVKASTLNDAQAEAQMLEFLRQHTDPQTSPMCGNSVHQDRRFLNLYMPALEDYFHYRNLDVSTLKELVRRWRPDLVAGLKKKGSHIALDDIRDSIEELRYYRTHFLKMEP